MLNISRIIWWIGLLAISSPAALFARQNPTTGAPSGMVLVSGGTYLPLYDNDGEVEGEQVDPFYIDISPVTVRQFLAFVQANPQWQRSRVAPIFAESSYLVGWAGDTDPGDLGLNQPVTNVSWFAAKAYARWKGNRLPTIAEWEFVAGAGQRSPDGKNEGGFEKRVLDLTNSPVQRPLPDVGQGTPNYWGVKNLHGLVWEWVSDFNSALVTGESRADASLERKLFCGSGVVGASDFTDYAAFMRFAFRGSLSASYSGSNLGFRTVRSY